MFSKQNAHIKVKIVRSIRVDKEGWEHSLQHNIRKMMRFFKLMTKKPAKAETKLALQARRIGLAQDYQNLETLR